MDDENGDHFDFLNHRVPGVTIEYRLLDPSGFDVTRISSQPLADAKFKLRHHARRTAYERRPADRLVEVNRCVALDRVRDR